MALRYESFDQTQIKSKTPKLLLLTSFLIIGAICSFSFPYQSSESPITAYQLEEFHNFMLRYNKLYPSNQEYSARLQIFTQNLNIIQDHNSQDLPWKLAVNQFADLTSEEFTEMLTLRPFSLDENLEEENHEDLDTPEFKDWVAEGKVAATQNAGSCGIAGISAGVGAVQSAHAIKTGELLLLSRQQVIDCGTFGYPGTCSDTTPEGVFKYASSFGGLENSSDYPGQGLKQECRQDSSKIAAKVLSYSLVKKNSESALKVATASSPVAVLVDAISWQFYSSGILSNCGKSLNHAVLVVGYGSVGSSEYWKLQNSWGTGWGEGGFIRILRNDSSIDGGMCGIAMGGSYPVV